MRLMLAAALATWGLAVAPSAGWPAGAVPGACPPICDAIPDSAWVNPTAVPLYPVYRWPGLAGLAVTAPSARFGLEALCASPPIAQDARAYAIGARSVVRGRFQSRSQVSICPIWYCWPVAMSYASRLIELSWPRSYSIIDMCTACAWCTVMSRAKPASGEASPGAVKRGVNRPAA